MLTDVPNTTVHLDRKFIDFKAVEYTTNMEGFPVPALDIVLTMLDGSKIYDDGSRVVITHNNINT